MNRAKREKTLPDVLSKEEIKKILDVTVTDMRLFCMFSILYSCLLYTSGFHRRQQARFRVKGARPGLFLFRAASFDGQLVAL